MSSTRGPAQPPALVYAAQNLVGRAFPKAEGIPRGVEEVRARVRVRVGVMVAALISFSSVSVRLLIVSSQADPLPTPDPKFCVAKSYGNVW